MAVVKFVMDKVNRDKAVLAVLEDLLATHQEVLDREAIHVFYRDLKLRITCNKIRCVREIWAALFGGAMPMMTQGVDGLELEAESDGLRILFLLPDFKNKPILQKLAV